jgi:hypothetical protein
MVNRGREWVVNTSSFFSFTCSTLLWLSYHRQHKTPFVQRIHPETGASDQKQALYNLFAAYIHTIPVEQLIESVERPVYTLN